jgi:hypothetical protein
MTSVIDLHMCLCGYYCIVYVLHNRYSSVTGESTYTNPATALTAAVDDSYYGYSNTALAIQNDGSNDSSVSEWSEHQDDAGYTYYYSSVTGVSTYDRPY